MREGIWCSLRGAAADAVHNMGPNVPLDMIIKKFTIIYGNVKSFNLLMRDFYRADQGEDETIPYFATRIEGLLSEIRDRFPNQLPHQEEQRLLKDNLFHWSRKSIRDSVKYCFADASVDYMHFLEECRKSEEEGKAGRAKAASKVKAAAATVSPTKQDEMAKQLKYQQHLKCLGGASEKFSVTSEDCTTLLQWSQDRELLLWERELWEKTQGTGRGGSWGNGQLSQPRTTPQPTFRSPRKNRELLNPINPISAGNVVRWGI